MAHEANILIVDLGSQLTQVIRRVLGELGFASIVLDPTAASKWLQEHYAKAIILSGGPASVYEDNAPQPPEELLPLLGSALEGKDGAPAILGICYGLQWLVHHLGGEVKAIDHQREYGQMPISIISHDSLFANTSEIQEVLMSHGDSVNQLPSGFKVLAKAAKSQSIAAIRKGKVWGVQFHPESTHSVAGGLILENFLTEAGCERDYDSRNEITAIQENVLQQMGENGRAIIGFSGGVDSTTLAAILAPVLVDRLYAITIDAGNLRLGELEEIKLHAKAAGIKNHIVVDAAERFFAALAGITDAEEKRQVFKKLYTDLFIGEASSIRTKPGYIVQGTLNADVIESGAKGGAHIKSHHNVGNKWGNLKELHPLQHLFKSEIRQIAKEMGLPESVWRRHPFPGPGLFLRVLGIPLTPELVEIVRWADHEVKMILVEEGIFYDLSQYLATYDGTKTVAVKGDKRVYCGSIIVRAVRTLDFMTAEGVYFSEPVAKKIITKLTAHPDVARVFFDSTPKPPATTEME